MPWPQDDSPIAPQPTPFGAALWKLLTNAVPAQLNTAGNLAAGVARPFTNLFGNGGQEFWQGPQNPQAAQDMRQALMTIYGGNALNPAAAETDALGAGIKAYHGSPYDFERFDASKIGTGEGAQAYGHGLYFAENEGVAKNYRDQLSTGFGNPNADNADSAARRALTFHAGDAQKAAADLETNAKALDATGIQSLQDRAKMLREAIGMVQSGKQLGGKMYEVNINASPDQFLDWDKPISQQPAPVQKYFEGKQPPEGQTWQGGDLIGGRQPTDQARIASELSQAGIPGIRYQDQGSRLGTSKAIAASDVQRAAQAAKEAVESGAPDAAQRVAEAQEALRKFNEPQQPTYNYVIFPGNEHLIEIVKKYGLAGAAAAMGMKQADLSQMMGLVGPQNKGPNQ